MKAILFLVSLALVVPSALRAVTLSLSPNSASNSYAGLVTVSITGLKNSETVWLDKFLDANSNGNVDAGEPLIQRLALTDGQVSVIGGVRNSSVPGDEDGDINGRINCRLNFAVAEGVHRAAGKFRFRVSSPTSRFSAVEQPLTLTAAAHSQSVTGRVYSAGAPLGQAVVGLLASASDQEFVAAAVANTSGDFNLPAPAGTYRLVAFKAGHDSVTLGADAPVLTLGAAQTLVANVTNTPASSRISGYVWDAVTTDGLGGMQLFFSSAEGHWALGFTDPSGAFNVPVTASQEWAVALSALGLAQRGYVIPSSSTPVGTLDAEGTADFLVAPATSLLYGTLTDETGRPVPRARIQATDYDLGLYAGLGWTATNGTFALGVAAGNNWFVEPAVSSLAQLGFLGLGGNASIQDGEAVQIDLQARPVSARIRGRVVQSDGAPVVGMQLSASSYEGFIAYTRTQPNGDFAIGVSAGDWTISFDPVDLELSGLLAPLLPPLSLTDGQETNGLLCILHPVTGWIIGTVSDTTNTPLASALVQAEAVIGGLVYGLNGATDEQGQFYLAVCDGTWTVSAPDLSYLGYEPPAPQPTTVVRSTNTVHFVVQSLGPLQILTESLPQARVGVPYQTRLQAAGGAAPYMWLLSAGLVPGLTLESDGAWHGLPEQAGDSELTVQVLDNNWNLAEQTYTFKTLPPAVKVTILSRPAYGQVQLRVTGVENQRYVVEASANLLDPAGWQPISTNQVMGGSATLTDSQANAPIRFYRARAL